MHTDKQMKALHDQASMALSPDDQALLDAWYARQDEEEHACLASAQEIHADLHAQVNTAVAQLVAVTQSVEEVNRQNDGLRREIAGLKQQLAKRPQPA